MKLISIDVEGYRRFFTNQCLQLDSALVALLGPNEAGKTSLLNLLLCLNNDLPFQPEGPSQELTRGQKFASNHTVILAKLRLEDADLDALKDIKDASRIRWVFVRKIVSGQRNIEFLPGISRDVESRTQIFNGINGISSLDVRKTYEAQKVTEEKDPPTEHIIETTQSLINGIDPNTETLPKEIIEKLRELAISLRAENNNSLSNLASDIANLVKNEAQKHPATVAANILMRRLPQFVMFSETDRVLNSSYDISGFFAAKHKTPIPDALGNLASFSGLDLKELFNAVTKKNEGKIETLLFSANETIKRKITVAWSQSNTFMRFRLNGNQLSILAGSLEAEFESIAEKSDGFRQFFALATFISKKVPAKGGVIVLIDEAEGRLHYDAQADLVQMLAKQDLAKKVIYTTHSIGCLPEDLGLGVRLVQPETGGAARSNIINKFWAQDDLGLSPILFGMGASTMAFLPVRRCVLVEGAADMLLLPALLREATARETLGYQVSPGLAEASGYGIAVLQNEGSHVAYLVDGDKGGKRIETKLRSEGVKEGKIISLKQIIGSECVIEDFVDKTVYANAFNEELKRSGHAERLNATDLPDHLRSGMIRSWCETNSIPEPGKVNVAYQILDQIQERSLIDPDHVDGLRSIDKLIKTLFKAE